MGTILSSLARQPTEKPVTKPKDYKKIKAKFNQMFTNRQKYVEKWKMIRDYQLPFLGVFDGEQDQSKLYTDKILTGIAWESCQIFASEMCIRDSHKGKIKQLEDLVNQLVTEVEELKAGK